MGVLTLHNSCGRTVWACFIMNIISMAVIQGKCRGNDIEYGALTIQYPAILVLRIYYLFSRQKMIQMIAIAGLIVCTAATATMLARFLRSFHVLPKPFAVSGCGAPPSASYWPVFLPAFILHSMLYLLTAYRTMKSTQSLNNTPLLKRLLRE